MSAVPLGGEKPTDVRGIDPVEVDEVRRRLADQSSESNLALGPSFALGESARGDGHSGARNARTGQQNRDLAIIPVDLYSVNATYDRTDDSFHDVAVYGSALGRISVGW
jgi:hypothetical protein